MDRIASGLSSEEAARRIASDGPNVLPDAPRRGLIRRLVRELVHFFALMLWVAAVLAIVAGLTQLGVAIMAVILRSRPSRSRTWSRPPRDGRYGGW